MSKLFARLMFWFGCLAALVSTARSGSAADPEKAVQRIAFGSCCKQDKPQPIWDSIVELKPEMFLFIGDNIYGDSTDMEVLQAKWKQLGDQPGYQKLKQTCPVLATWDDHDFGADDAGADYPQRKESQQLFLDFFDEPRDSPRRKQAGVYDAKVFGPADRKVQIILLDTRYHRSPLVKGYKPGEPGEGMRGIYVPNTDPTTTMLGAEQWAWLEQQLRVPAKLRIIASSIQVIPSEHGSEKWGNFPHERNRLLKLIETTRANGVVFISGDRHLAEISRLDRPANYPLFDVTSSSLNAPSGNITKAGIRFMNEINSHRVGLQFFETNFGLIEIDWQLADPILRLQVRDELGQPVLQQRLSLNSLFSR